jgi:hypothetical protein
MHKMTLATALSALFIAAPVGGAYAESAENSARDGYPYIDYQTTQGIPRATALNYDRLETELVAVETNLDTGVRDKGLTESEVLAYRGQIQSIRQSAAEERAASGDLSPTSFASYNNQVMMLQQAIERGH